MDTSQRLDDLPSTTSFPFHRIPDELLAMILVWTSRALGNDHLRFRFPLTIPQQVSRRWKNVTLTTPGLWTTLHVNPWHASEGIQKYLLKSGIMTLNLNVLNSRHLPQLILHAGRWERVSVWMDEQTDLDRVLERISPLAISLRHFSVSLPSAVNGSIPSTTLRTLNPSLETLHLTNTPLDWSTAPFMFKNLTELSLTDVCQSPEDVGLEGLLDTLRASPQLKRLEIFGLLLPSDDIRSWLVTKFQSQRVDLFNLEELVICEVFVAEFLFLTSQIHSPQLQKLGVGLYPEYDYGEPPWVMEPDWNTCSPTYPHLRHLVLRSRKTSPKELLLAIQNITSISTLSIHGNDLWSGEDITKVVTCLQCFQSLNHLTSTVRTLITRDINISSLRTLINGYLPGVEKIYGYWKDAETVQISGVGVRFVDKFCGLPNVIPWGMDDESCWNPERTEERRDRVDDVFVRESTTQVGPSLGWCLGV